MSDESARPKRDELRETHTPGFVVHISTSRIRDAFSKAVFNELARRICERGRSSNLEMQSIRHFMKSTMPETSVRLIERRESNLRHHAARLPSFPRLWELLGWVLPSKLRRTVYEPYRQELLEDYLVSRKQSRTSAARRWLFICYTLWTVYAVVLSILAGLSSVAGQRLKRLLPQRWRRWWLP